MSGFLFARHSDGSCHSNGSPESASAPHPVRGKREREGGSGMTSEDKLYNKETPPPPAPPPSAAPPAPPPPPPALPRQTLSELLTRGNPPATLTAWQCDTVSLDGARPRGVWLWDPGPEHRCLAPVTGLSCGHVNQCRHGNQSATSHTSPNDKVKEMKPLLSAFLHRDYV